MFSFWVLQWDGLTGLDIRTEYKLELIIFFSTLFLFICSFIRTMTLNEAAMQDGNEKAYYPLFHNGDYVKIITMNDKNTDYLIVQNNTDGAYVKLKTDKIYQITNIHKKFKDLNYILDNKYIVYCAFFEQDSDCEIKSEREKKFKRII